MDVYIVDVLELAVVDHEGTGAEGEKVGRVVRLYTRSLGVSVPSQPP